MDYKISITSETTPTYWSGGAASELITYPEGSSFKERNFLWRLGFAKIDIEKSAFSRLDGVNRWLMVTENSITLHHKDQYDRHLELFETDNFQGSFETTTEGKCSVFNLMTRKNYEGGLEHIKADDKNNGTDFYFNMENAEALCIHPLNNELFITFNNEKYYVEKGGLFTLKPESKNLSSLKFIFQGACDIIISYVFQKKGDLYVSNKQ